MEKKVITHIMSQKYVDKVDKYVVELSLYGAPKETVWLTEKQMINLERCFSQTMNGYSTKAATVTGHWNGRGYYAYATVGKQKTVVEFEEPEQQDVSDLWEAN